MTLEDACYRPLVISDGKRGHLNQSLAIARRLGEPCIVEMHLSRWEATLINLAACVASIIGRNACSIASQLIRLPVKEAQSTSSDVIVSGGQTVAGVAVLLKHTLRIPAVVLMRPAGIPLSAFDVVVAPVHDFPPGKSHPPNVVVTLTAVTEPLAGATEVETSAFSGDGGNVALLVGGDAQGVTLNAEAVLGALQILISWASGNNARVLLATSRRTPPELSMRLKSIARDSGGLVESVFADMVDTNPLATYFRRSKHIVVTDDSFSMVSEAIHAGKVPYILRTAPRRKFQRTYQILVQRGYAIWGDLEGLGSYLETDPGASEGNGLIETATREVRRILDTKRGAQPR
ncbi:MAG: ELM1/GtrOC1 family putative glycosyltransferase [bacterium JZ-2024 1]